MTDLETQSLRLLCWEGYQSQQILAPFEQRHGIRTHAQTLLSDATTATTLACGDYQHWDVLNINNAYVRDYLHPRGLVATLDEESFAAFIQTPLVGVERLRAWTQSAAGELIGVCQRFGPFNLVVNTRRIDIDSAQDQGFALTQERRYRRRFAILEYDDFNLFHLCIATGLNPFECLDESQEQSVERTAQSWYDAALLATDDHHALNRALANGEIDFYVSGGVYTVSPARRDGQLHLRAVTPRSGPIDGCGGVMFTEITSVLRHANLNPLAPAFLGYLLEPGTALRAAFLQNTCNPVAQMAEKRVFDLFTTEQLRVIQWDSLLEDVSHCADYQLMPNHDSLLARLLGVRARARLPGKSS